METVYFGPILGSFTSLAFVSARCATRIGRRVGMVLLTFATLLLTVFSLALLTVAESLPLCLVAMGVLGIASGGVRPLTLCNLSQEDLSESEHRRALSMMEQRTGILSAAVILLGGVLLGLDVLTFRELMSIIVGCYLAVVIALFIFRRESPRLVASRAGAPV